VLEYFDAFLIGLTATPSKQTLGFFNQNLVTEYPHERAVADGVNVGYEVYRIQTLITEEGSTVEAGYYIDKRDKLTRRTRWELLDDDLEYTARQLDREVVAEDQIRTVIRTFRDRLFSDIFPGRQEVPKTLIFAKDDSHAEDIVHIVREEFGSGNDFCKKITYKTTGDKPEDLIASFRNSYNPRIAVTVDMISTGTDIRPLECLVFMRDVKSRVYFEQMKGRGTRTIIPDDLIAVTPSAPCKTHFVIVDAVGVCEADKTDSRPLERNPSVPFDKLLERVALGVRDEDTLTSLAGRLARLDRELEPRDRAELEAASAGGQTLKQLVNGLLDAVDADKQMETAQEMFEAEAVTAQQVSEATERLVRLACAAFDSPQLRNTLVELRQRKEQVIDTVSKDAVLVAEFDDQAREKARTIVNTFRQFIEDNKDQLTALQMIYERPYSLRKVTYDQIKELAGAIEKPPYGLTQEAVWRAYEKLDQSRVRGAGPGNLLSNIVSLVRFAVGQSDVLEPFPLTVDERFANWLAAQAQAGRQFTPEQLEWLGKIKEHVATSLRVETEDFEYAPFYEMGGLVKAHQLFGNQLDNFLGELTRVLVV
jgi:type I restriction enzyme R subunit